MTATTAEALEAQLPKLIKTGTVFHAFHDEDDHWDGNEIYADLDTAQKHSAALYASEEYGGATIPAGALEWRKDGNRWELVDQGSYANIIVQGRHIFGTQAGEPQSADARIAELEAERDKLASELEQVRVALTINPPAAGAALSPSCSHGPGFQCVECVPDDGVSFRFQPLGGV